MRRSHHIADLLVLAVLAIIAGGLIWLMTLNNRTARECLNLGYAQHRVMWGFLGVERFCISRENQSDIVRTLSEARQHPRR